MKSVKLFLGILTVVSFVFTSCQKGYSPEGLVLPGTNGGGGTGALLLKAEATTTGTTEGTVTTYTYDGSKRITKINIVETDSFNVSTSYYYEYTRDAEGKVTVIKTNILSVSAPGAGFPAVLNITVHYPAGSSNFDYSVYSYSFSGFDIRDSTAYAYTSNKVTSVNTFQSSTLIPAIAVNKVQYAYTGSNITSTKIYDPTDNSLLGTIAYEFDNKVPTITAGNEAFLPGMDLMMSCANNPARITFSTPSSPGALVMEYTYQYNTGLQPNGGTVIETPGPKTRALKFTYQ